MLICVSSQSAMHRDDQNMSIKVKSNSTKLIPFKGETP